jgi:hypothetical protein
MSESMSKPRDPAVLLEQLRKRIRGGGRPALEDLEGEEMAAAHELISSGEAEVIHSGCHLYLSATLK